MELAFLVEVERRETLPVTEGSPRCLFPVTFRAHETAPALQVPSPLRGVPISRRVPVKRLKARCNRGSVGYPIPSMSLKHSTGKMLTVYLSQDTVHRQPAYTQVQIQLRSRAPGPPYISRTGTRSAARPVHRQSFHFDTEDTGPAFT